VQCGATLKADPFLIFTTTSVRDRHDARSRGGRSDYLSRDDDENG
jgi:hypothetical protein